MTYLLRNLKLNNRVQYAFIPALSIAFSIALLIYRVHFSDTITYAFLVWNIFLACIPFIISSLIITLEYELSTWLLLLLLGAWLVFFPNAPYIVTDLFHLGQRQNVPLWYDLMLIVSFCW